MPTSRVVAPPTEEPISLGLVNAHLRLDLAGEVVAAYEAAEPTPDGADAAQWAQLELLALYRTAAREKVEAYTERYFAPQTVEYTFELGEPYVVPLGAVPTGDALGGFIMDLSDVPLLSGSPVDAEWLEEYRKGISVNRELPWDQVLRQTFTVVLDVPADAQYLGVAKRAMLELIGEWYRNRETTADARGLSELPVAWRMTLAEARLNPLGVS